VRCRAKSWRRNISTIDAKGAGQRQTTRFNGAKMRIKVFVCILSLLSLSGSQAQQQRRVTGFFTDMHYVPEAGDVIGTEVWIVYARGQYYATVQDAQGEPDPPVIVPVEVSGSKVKFSTRTPTMNGNGSPALDLVVNYVGTVTTAGLVLSDSGSARLLKRRNSYWQ